MCLYPALMPNKKYTRTKKNGGNIPPITDQRLRYVAIGCQQCIECRKQKARGWQVRLLEEVKEHTNGKFITLTFNDEAIKYHMDRIRTTTTSSQEPDKIPEGYDMDNAIATRATREFLERWRKKYKRSFKHWFITELGHTGTENIHIHGIIWTNETMDTIRTIWNNGTIPNGYMYPRPESKEKNWVNAQTVNYIIKYVTKQDLDHPNYKPRILTSKGIGKNYINKGTIKENKYKPNQTTETYRTSTGHKIALPIYYRNKIYTEEEKEKLWIEKLDKETRYVKGEKISVKNNNTKEYEKLLKWHQHLNESLGYGQAKKNWDKIAYETNRRILLQDKRRADGQKKQ